MSIHYVCRHCGHYLGHIEQSTTTETHLGFHTLTKEEREEIISYDENGDIKANVVCEHCQEAIYRHPELLLHPSILQ